MPRLDYMYRLDDYRPYYGVIVFAKDHRIVAKNRFTGHIFGLILSTMPKKFGWKICFFFKTGVWF